MLEITIEGATYRLPSPTDGSMQKKLLALAKAAEPDPLRDAVAVCKDLPPEAQRGLLEKAMELKYARQSATREEQEAKLQAYCSTPEGLEKFLLLLWQTHQPALTEDQVWALHGKAIEQHGEEYFAPKGT